MGLPWRANKFFHWPGFCRLGHAGGAIARLNNGQRPSRKQHSGKKRRTLKTSGRTGIYEAKEKPANRHLFY